MENHQNIIWFHCASLGEFEQGRPIIEGLKKKWPQSKILLTFFSPSGYEIRKNYDGADFVFYLPMDSKANARRMLEIVKPAAVIFVKYEFWYHYLHEINKRNIPLLLISAVFRKDQPFFKWWGKLHRKMLSFFSVVFVQDDISADLLKEKKLVRHCYVSGDTRFDRVIEVAADAGDIPVIEKFSNNCKLIIAGSTWKEDEHLLNKFFHDSTPGLKLVIAPHEVSQKRIHEVATLFRDSVKYSQFTSTGFPQGNPSVLIIDNIGMLSRLYRYGYINYVGGGFSRDGVHNVLEAAVYGNPVLLGPNYSKYREAVDLVNEGGAYSVANEVELKERLEVLLTEANLHANAGEIAGEYVRSRGGATDRILRYLEEIQTNKVN